MLICPFCRVWLCCSSVQLTPIFFCFLNSLCIAYFEGFVRTLYVMSHNIEGYVLASFLFLRSSFQFYLFTWMRIKTCVSLISCDCELRWLVWSPIINPPPLFTLMSSGTNAACFWKYYYENLWIRDVKKYSPVSCRLVRGMKIYGNRMCQSPFAAVVGSKGITICTCMWFI